MGGAVTGVSWKTNVLGSTSQNAGTVTNLPVASEDCDLIGIDAVMAQFDHIAASGAINLGGAAKKVELSPTGVRQRSGPGGVIEYPEYATHAVSLFGSNTTLIRVPSVTVGGSAQLSVAGGHVVLLVDGNFTYGGGGLGLEVAAGSTLTILVKGKIEFGSGNATITSGGMPPINIFSSYRNNGFSKWDSNSAGVKVAGNAKLDASIYAPFSSVAMDAPQHTPPPCSRVDQRGAGRRSWAGPQ